MLDSLGAGQVLLADRAYDKERSYRPGELVEGRFDDLTNPPGIERDYRTGRDGSRPA